VNLILAFTAVGAFYPFEQASGYELYFAAKTLIDERVRKQNQQVVAQLKTTSPN
jgi:hypothetical protein